MLINNLNDDCLMIIFTYINDFHDLLNLSQVCSRWSSLLSIGYTNKELLLCWSKSSEPDKAQYITKPHNFTKLNVSLLLPDVKILDVNFKHYRNISYDKFFEIGQKNLTIKGIVCEKSCIDLYMLSCFPNLEMLVCSSLLHNRNYPFDISKLKQLYIRNGSLKILSKYGQSLNNLLRIHLYQGQHFQPYSGGNISNLKILEYDSEMNCDLQSSERDFDGFHLMDFCSSLESAYLTHRTKKCIINTSIVNHNLSDLVIQQKFENYHDDCLPYVDIFKKFPNLLHLAIRNSNDINDDDIIKFVKLLPKVELLDFRGSPRITSKSAKLLKDYCKQSGRSIEINYGNRLQSDAIWMDFNSFKEKIVFEFDFMKHCFDQPFDQLPILMIPE